MSTPPVIWTIAGFDPSSGAGITADLKTISSFGCYGAACITALTVQNTLGVRRVEPVSPQTLRETLHALLEDIPPDAIKIGMLSTSGVASLVADFLETLLLPLCPVVLDPILRSSSGAELLDAAGVQILIARLLPLASVVTPNRHEAAILTGLGAQDAEGAATALRQMGAAAAVVTGGDSSAPGAVQYSEDVLAYGAAGMEFVETLSAPRIQSSATHGTGCAFSTAIACGLAQGQGIPAAVTAAKAFVRRAIEQAPGIGHGKGPMGLDRAARD
ncbi:MAG: bifunctional hydroxymethylpyrimidine kinase/phosphomethylpyrimidine kinase [Candidatus Korobacteraceae bacterium]